MLRKLGLTAALIASGLTIAAPTAQAGSGWSLQPASSYGHDDWRDPDGRYENADWRDGDRGQRGSDYRGKRCDKGTAGLIVGGVLGGVVGNRIAKGDRTAGTIIGAGVGAITGRAIDRSSSKRC